MLRFIARHVSGFAAPLAAFLTVGMLVAAIGVAIFAGIAELVEDGVTQIFDDRVLHWFAQIRTPFLDELMLEITSLGAGMVLIMIVLVASVFLWQTQHKWSVYLLLLATLGGQFINRLLKIFYERPRPGLVESLTPV